MGLEVLIVDDSASMRSIVRKIVGLSGYEISTYYESSNGLEALDILSKQWIDIILLDINMPQMDGITFLREMKKEELYKKIPVVLVTTEARQDTVDEAFNLGVKAHIKKPFQPEQIRQILDDILGDEYVREDRDEPDEGDF